MHNLKACFQSKEDGNIVLEHPENLAAYLDLIQVLCSLARKKVVNSKRRKKTQHESLLKKLHTHTHLRKLKSVNNRKQPTVICLGLITWFVFLSSPSYCLPFPYFTPPLEPLGGWVCVCRVRQGKREDH